MSAVLLPDIGQLDPHSLCHTIYSQLYHNFFNAQDKKTPEIHTASKREIPHPYD